MKLRGGYNIRLAGRPAGRIDAPDQPELLLLPQRSRRLQFNKLLVKSGQSVRRGQVLALATGQFDLPLLAPRDGLVRLRVQRGHIQLEASGRETPPVTPAGDASAGTARQALIDLGVWPYLYDAHSGEVPDPARPVSAALVATTQLEPFAGPRGDVLLQDSLEAFLRGLDGLVSLVEGVTYVAVPRSRSSLAVRLRQSLAGTPRIQVVDIPLRYPLDRFSVLARALGLKPTRGQTVWGLQAEGVLAIDQALHGRQPVLDRVVAVGGSAVSEPVHLRVPLGYPLRSLLAGRVAAPAYRVIEGGILNGETVGEQQLGIGAETGGLTVLLEPARRELWGFVRTGLDRISYSNCYLSLFRPRYAERLTTALRGEHRPCIGCGFCEALCPAGIMPHWIHKLVYQDALEEIDRCAPQRCVGCGLCSYVCPAKLDLRREILDARDKIRRELHVAETAEAEEVAR